MFREGGPSPEQTGNSAELDNRPQISEGDVNEQASTSHSRQVEEPPEFSISLPDKKPIDLAIASYFREKGPQALWAAYRNMAEDGQKGLKQAIADGNLEGVVRAVEWADPLQEQAEKMMHAENESRDDFVRAFEKTSFLMLDRIRELAFRHRARALEWQRTGIEPEIAETPAVRRRLAEMPMDLRDFLERIPPRIRQRVISDDELLHTPMEQLIKDYPQLSKRIGREYLMHRGQEKR